VLNGDGDGDGDNAPIFPLNDEGMSGGGNVEPLLKLVLFDVLNCSSVGAFIELANGFGVRAVIAVEPNGFVVAEHRFKYIERTVTSTL
jgi:hypothetical protein